MNHQEICLDQMQQSGNSGVYDSGATAGFDACPERIAKVLVKRGWCHTEYGWSHEKIAPVNVQWQDAVDIQLSLLSPVTLARLELY